MTVTDAQIRLKLLELAKPEKVSAPDVEYWVNRARELEAYVTEGQSRRTPKNGRSAEKPAKSDNSQEPGDQVDLISVLNE